MTEAQHADDAAFMKLAYEEARAGFEEGGVPVGAVMVENGAVTAAS